MSYDPARQWHRIKLSEKTGAGKFYILDFSSFTGMLSINLRGWYLSSYVENNVTK